METTLMMISVLSFFLFIVLPIAMCVMIGRYVIRKVTGQKPEALLQATHRSVNDWVQKP
ncbi:hypothetical protein [Methylobacterium sp. Leaf100]|uniref:hypothetical protein n=1 Tax=Methylobacterium sp. Leaf100 TaxID=1736252 RepID=UPI000ADBE47A|nr:hypothetical protein [Methylobacterium sp. Leaf100]